MEQRPVEPEPSSGRLADEIGFRVWSSSERQLVASGPVDFKAKPMLSRIDLEARSFSLCQRTHAETVEDDPVPPQPVSPRTTLAGDDKR